MANIWEHPQVIAAEALRHLEDALVITRMCAMDSTSEFTTRANGWKKGDTVSFRTHGDYVSKDFDGEIDIQGIRTSSRPMMIEKHLDVSVEMTAREEALDLDSLSDQVIRPASYRLAEDVELYVGSKILQAAGLYASDDLMASAADAAQARKTATIQQLAPNRFCVLDVELEAKVLGQTWFNQSQTRGSDGETTLRTGMMGPLMGMDWYAAMSFPSSSHTAGEGASATDNASGTKNLIGDKVLSIDTLTNQIEAGDRLQIAGVRRPLIAAEQTLATSTTVALVDPITEIIPDNAAVTVVGSGNTIDFMGAIFDDRSLAVAFPMLDQPGDKVTGVASNNGVSIRVVKGSEMKTKKTILSMDLLVGAFAFDPRRITLLGQY
jgi:hypothetical protein